MNVWMLIDFHTGVFVVDRSQGVVREQRRGQNNDTETLSSEFNLRGMVTTPIVVAAAATLRRLAVPCGPEHDANPPIALTAIRKLAEEQAKLFA